MKSLITFIKEAEENTEIPASKTFTFDLTDIENKDELLKSLGDNESVEIEDNIIKLTVNKDDLDSSESARETIDDFVKTARKSQTNASNETYAQKTKKLKNEVESINDYISSINSESEEKEKNDDKSKNEKDENE